MCKIKDTIENQQFLKDNKIFKVKPVDHKRPDWLKSKDAFINFLIKLGK